MNAVEQQEFIRQIAFVIKQQKGSEDYSYYQHFYQECLRYKLTEDDFRKMILIKAYEQAAGTMDEEQTQGPHAVVFGKRIFNLKQLGKQLFDFPAKSELYLEDASLLKKDILEFEKTDQVLEVIETFNKEKLPAKRYRRMVYHLNPQLPYRIENDLSDTLEVLLQKGFQHYPFYEQVVNQFASGYLQIWLEETNPAQAARLGHDTGHNSFLQFIYSVNKDYTLYIKEDYFFSPADVVDRALTDLYFRGTLYQYLKSGRIQIWFASKGYADWNTRYAAKAEQISRLSHYNSQEKIQAQVQALLQIIDPEAPAPKITADVDLISLLSVEAARTVHQKISFSLVNTGVVKALIRLDKTFTGISIDADMLSLDSFEQVTVQTVTLTVNPTLLIKDKVYQTQLIVESVDETVITIPVEIKAVFPQKAYILSLLKYGVLSAVYFVIIRFLVTAFTGHSALLHKFNYGINWKSALPENYFLYVLAFLIMLGTLWVCYRMIRQVEKI